ncbi:MAG: hypothetical protein LBC29_04820, partial [Propionibacteriaceae bacterium]|nr:hypothetical protein [Propionibacteriaceae bacterium]
MWASRIRINTPLLPSRWLGARRLLLAVALLLPVTACTTTPPEPEVFGGAYHQEFFDAIRDAPNDYVREALSDGVVTRAEVIDAQAKVVQCIETSDLGIRNFGYQDDGQGGFSFGFETSSELTLEQKLGMRACRMQWLDSLESLYDGVRTNPDNERWDELFAACLVRHELVPSGFTATDYMALLKEQGDKYGIPLPLDDLNQELINRGEIEPFELTTIPDGTPPIVLPGGRTMDDPEVVE